MKPYTQKDLGYPRKPTSAVMHVTMDDLTVWAVPVQAIADSRDEHYADDKEDTIGFIRNKSLEQYEIKDWAANNMNWSDVKEFAAKVESAFVEPDWQEGWISGEKKLVGDI